LIDLAHQAAIAEPGPHDIEGEEGRIRFRVRIGVTGHRDPAGLSEVRRSVRDRLDEIRVAFPPTGVTGVRFAVLSSLAEGGDRLVVKEAFAALADADVGLHVVLPMGAEDYIEDFLTPDSRREFVELLNTAAVTTQLPPIADRDEAYERAGQYVVDNSDVVLALWDGRTARGRGGTAAIVSYARRSGVPVLVVPVARTTTPDQSPAEPRGVPAVAVARDRTLEAYRRIDEFNRRSIREPDLAAAVIRERTRLHFAEHDDPTRERCDTIAAWSLSRLARADALALKYQKLYYRMASALYLLAALAVTVVAAQSQAHWSPKLALVEVAFMLAVLAIYGYTRHTGIRDRWLGYRSLAEALRAALFIAVANPQIEDMRTSLDGAVAVRGQWFQRAFSATWEARPTIAPAAGDPTALREFLIEGWLEHQVSYHRNLLARLRRGRIRLTRAVFALFIVTILAGLLHAFEVLPEQGWSSVLLFLALALPGFGAALTGIRDLRQYRIHEHRSERTASRLERLRSRVETTDSPSPTQKLAAQVQSAIEAEATDWSSVVEFQDLEVVV
jgi:hypothetical protein